MDYLYHIICSISIINCIQCVDVLTIFESHNCSGKFLVRLYNLISVLLFLFWNDDSRKDSSKNNSNYEEHNNSYFCLFRQSTYLLTKVSSKTSLLFITFRTLIFSSYWVACRKLVSNYLRMFVICIIFRLVHQLIFNINITPK